MLVARSYCTLGSAKRQMDALVHEGDRGALKLDPLLPFCVHQGSSLRVPCLDQVRVRENQPLLTNKPGRGACRCVHALHVPLLVLAVLGLAIIHGIKISQTGGDGKTNVVQYLSDTLQ